MKSIRNGSRIFIEQVWRNVSLINARIPRKINRQGQWNRAPLVDITGRFLYIGGTLLPVNLREQPHDTSFVRRTVNV